MFAEFEPNRRGVPHRERQRAGGRGSHPTRRRVSACGPVFSLFLSSAEWDREPALWPARPWAAACGPWIPPRNMNKVPLPSRKSTAPRRGARAFPSPAWFRRQLKPGRPATGVNSISLLSAGLTSSVHGRTTPRPAPPGPRWAGMIGNKLPACQQSVRYGHDDSTTWPPAPGTWSLLRPEHGRPFAPSPLTPGQLAALTSPAPAAPGPPWTRAVETPPAGGD